MGSRARERFQMLLQVAIQLVLQSYEASDNQQHLRQCAQSGCASSGAACLQHALQPAPSVALCHQPSCAEQTLTAVQRTQPHQQLSAQQRPGGRRAAAAAACRAVALLGRSLPGINHCRQLGQLRAVGVTAWT